jgi:hypothetical protein
LAFQKNVRKRLKQSSTLYGNQTLPQGGRGTIVGKGEIRGSHRLTAWGTGNDHGSTDHWKVSMDGITTSEDRDTI